MQLSAASLPAADLRVPLTSAITWQTSRLARQAEACSKACDNRQMQWEASLSYFNN